MRHFNKAFDVVMQHEGLYSNDKNDRGKETCMGISRLHNPLWPGWSIVEECKKDFKAFPRNLNNVIGLKDTVKAFYAQKYWNQVCGDRIEDEKIAIAVFSIAVVSGVKRASRYLQNGLNLLNRQEALYSNIIVDEDVGSITIGALNKYLLECNPEYLLRLIVCQWVNHYMSLTEKKEDQEKFIRGWTNRAFSLL
jgi:lysozyme family protein